MKHTATILLDHKSFGRTPSDTDIRDMLVKLVGEAVYDKATVVSDRKAYSFSMYEHRASVYVYEAETLREIVIIIEGMQVIAKVSGDVYMYDLTLKLLNLLNQ